MFWSRNKPALVALLAVSLTGGVLRAEVTLEENVTYGKGGDSELKRDIARPNGEGPFPAIVFIHGGGWSKGSRQGYRSQIMEAAKRGYVAATISYRLMKFDETKKETTTATPIFPAQIHDAKAAIRWMRANAAKYHVDPSRIGVTGGSAGGHLSLLVNHGDSLRLRAFCNLSGETGKLGVGRHPNPFGCDLNIRWFPTGEQGIEESHYCFFLSSFISSRSLPTS